MASIVAGINQVTLSGDLGSFEATLSAVDAGGQVELVTLTLKSPTPAKPNKISLLFNVPAVDVQGTWSPNAGARRGLSPNWAGGVYSNATSGAPVVTLFGGDAENRATVALSDALNGVDMRASIVEETACFECGVKLFGTVSAEIDSYSVTLRIDRSARPFYKVLDDVRAWWEEMPEYAPASVPDVARRPLYSTWYSMHQHVAPDTIEEQCRLAKELGCDAVIVDDGWQTDNNERGYAYCGDWEVFDGKMPNMRDHVARVHDLGLKYILWYSVPFIGVHSKAWARFEDKLIKPHNSPGKFAVIDPRYPDTREYLIDVYERAVRDWDLDGFKLDFVDSFPLTCDAPLYPEQVDTLSVPVAVDKLLSAVIERLKVLKPDICIEFRQSYVGPLMRKFGNMFRAGDCPVDAVGNRMRTVDIRLLCGSSAAHADMVMWHNDEPVESAALQLLNVLFAVPQVSVLLDKVPVEHVEMVRFWLGFWNQYRHVLLDAPIEPTSPELLYPSVSAEADGTRIAVDYGAGLVSGRGASSYGELIVVNAKRTAGVFVDDVRLGNAHVWIFDCAGKPVSDGSTVGEFDGHVAKLEIPPSGLAVISRERSAFWNRN